MKTRAKENGPIDLAASVLGYLGGLTTCETGACVAVSLANFTNACKGQGREQSSSLVPLRSP
ncbi:MAG: hypothetical protein COB39_09270 [Marinosulfonomonas sp.]|nr:MAG: hypothetical protein COB39_09270 [Marinosulfonomonas sp.]